jgi:hypothetical protein
VTVVTADRAWSSEIPVFSVMRLINSSIVFLLWEFKLHHYGCRLKL